MPSPPVPGTGTAAMKVLNRATGAHVRIYRATRGRVGGRMRRAPVLLLHHVGRKSGAARVNPLIYVEDGANRALIASAGGREKHPAWWHNLRAQPETEVEVGGQRRRVRAREAEGEERERIWNRAVAVYPDYETYQQRAARRVPVVVLEPLV